MDAFNELVGAGYDKRLLRPGRYDRDVRSWSLPRAFVVFA